VVLCTFRFSNNLRRPTPSRVAVTSRCGRSLTLLGAQSGIRTRLTMYSRMHSPRSSFFARLDRTTYHETVDILTGCSPVSIPVQPVRSDHDRLDFAHPLIAVQASRGKVRDNLEHVIGESADV